MNKIFVAFLILFIHVAVLSQVFIGAGYTNSASNELTDVAENFKNQWGGTISSPNSPWGLSAGFLYCPSKENKGFALSLQYKRLNAGKIEIKDSTIKDQPIKSLGIPPFVNGSLMYPDFSKAKPSYHTLMLGIANVGFPHIPLWSFGILKWISKKAVNKGFIV